jgi:peptide/nickel transport system permease protein
MSLQPVSVLPPEHSPASTTGRFSRFASTWQRNLGASAGIGVILIIATIAMLAPVAAPYAPNQISGSDLAPPTPSHWLGLDYGGHDVLSSLIWGARGSLTIGLFAALLSFLIGGLIGLTGGYFGGWIDLLLALVTDFFLVIPVLPLMITLAALYGSSQTELVLIIGLLSWMRTARVVRAQARSLRERLYVRRAHSFGAGHMRILASHVAPQLAPLAIASTTLAIAHAIFAEAALSFLGLGDVSQPSWGNMIALNFQGGAMTAAAWWSIVPPGAAIALVVLCANVVGGSLEGTLNPRLAVSYLSRQTFALRQTTRPPLFVSQPGAGR